MKIFMSIEKHADTYSVVIDALPNFNLSGSSVNDVLAALPENLKNFTLNWEVQTDPTSSIYQREFPYIQRLKSRGFYQSTAHRFQEVVAKGQLDTLDLEFIHCLQRKEYEEFMSTVVNH